MKSSIKRIISAVIILSAICMLCACSNADNQNEASEIPTQSPSQDITSNSTPETTPAPTQIPDNTGENSIPTEISGELAITLNYEKISGSASNQYAIWIEDADGNYINSVFATQWTAQGGYRTRPDSIALWAAKSDIASMPGYYVDAISGATPQSGTQSYTWDLKDIDGNTVAPGEYIFFVEGTLRWKNYVLYSGVIDIGSEPVTVEAVVEYVYEGSDRYDALSSDSPENAMIGTVTASFIPAGE